MSGNSQYDADLSRPGLPENALSDQRVFQVSDENWTAFMDILEAPARPDPDIVALARSKAPWDR